MEDAITIKIVIIGECSVGKSNVLLRYVQNQFNDNMRATVATEFHTLETTFNDSPVRIQLWDTAGQERYRSLIPSFFARCDGAVLVYDLTNKDTFNKITDWIELLKEKASEDTKLLLIGNKTDLVSQRQVTPEEAISFAKELNVFYYETSAKDNANGNIEAAFGEIVGCCIEEKIAQRNKEDQLSQIRASKRGSLSVLAINKDTQEKGNKCC